MMIPSSDSLPAQGLRQRKKAKTRDLIQQQALRLFKSQGYDKTTIDDISEAAEISQSTFFRYFPTKESVLAHTIFNPMLLAAIKAQPRDQPIALAIRLSLTDMLQKLEKQEVETLRARLSALLNIHALRTQMIESLAQSIAPLAEIIAERTGRNSRSIAVRTEAGLIIGVIIAAIDTAAADENKDLMQLIDTSLKYIEKRLTAS